MKRNRCYILFYLISLPAFTACNSVTIAPPKDGSEEMVGIIGEISSGGNSRVGVYYAGNLTTGSDYRFISDATVSLLSSGMTVSTFTPIGSRYYSPAGPLAITEKQSLTLSCKVGSSAFLADMVIPGSFTLSGNVSSGEITLDVKPTATGTYCYVVEAFSVSNGSRWPLPVVPTDKLSENYRYNELPENGSTVFYRNITGNLNAKLAILEPTQGSRYAFVVKAVDEQYYQFLYYNEMQSNGKGLSIKLPTNIKGGAIGFVGAAFIRQLDL